MGKGTSTTTTQRADPWEPAQPYILQGLESASAMWNSDPNQFVIDPWQGQTVASEDPALQAARNAIGGYGYTAPKPQNSQAVNPAIPTPSAPPTPTAAPTPTGGGTTGGSTGGLQPADQPFQFDLSKYTTQSPYQTPTVPQQNYGGGGSVINSQLGMLSGAQSNAANIANLSGTNPTTGAFNAGINAAQNGTNAGAFNTAINNTAGAGVNPGLYGATSNIANMGLTSGLWDAARNISNTGVASGFQNAASNIAGMGIDPRLNAAIGAQFGGNSTAFNKAVNNATNDPMGQQLRAKIQQNVAEGVMPNVNSTFGVGGMTGSSLHSAAASKAMTNALAPIELQAANQAADRALQAGGMSQSALQAQREAMLRGGLAGQGSNVELAGLNLNAQGAIDSASRAQNSQNIAAQSTLEGLRQNRAGMALDAQNTLNNAENTLRAQQLQAGGMAQGALEGSRDRSLAAGQTSQNAYNTNLQRSLQATGMAPALSDAYYRPLERQEEVGQARTQQAQAQLAADIMANQQAQAAPIDALNNYLSLTSGLGGQFGTSMATSEQNPGLLGTLGFGLQGAGLLGSLFNFSDRRLKENIRRVGATDAGLPVYTYNYKGDTTAQMGVMADEAEKIAPHAVTTHPNGYKMVNYGEIA